MLPKRMAHSLFFLNRMAYSLCEYEGYMIQEIKQLFCGQIQVLGVWEAFVELCIPHTKNMNLFTEKLLDGGRVVVVHGWIAVAHKE